MVKFNFMSYFFPSCCFWHFVLFGLWFNYVPTYLPLDLVVGFGICHRKEVLMTFLIFSLIIWRSVISELFPVVRNMYPYHWLYYNMDKASMNSYWIFLSSLLFLWFYFYEKNWHYYNSCKKILHTLFIFLPNMIIYY